MRKRRIIKSTGCLAAACLLLSNAALADVRFSDNVSTSSKQVSVEQARSAEEWAKLRDNTVEWDELQDLVHEYNPTVSKLWINFQQEDKNGAYSSSYDDVLDLIEENYQDSLKSAGDSQIMEELAELQYKTSNTESSVDSSAQSTDREAAKLSCEKSEKSVTETIRTSIISLYKAELQKQQSELSRDNLKSAYERSERQQAAGKGTEADTLSAKQSLQEAELTLQKSSDSMDKQRQLILVNLGYKYNDDVTLPEVPTISSDTVNAIDLSADTQKALQNNYSILINERKLAVSTAESSRSSLTETIANEKENVRSDMQSRYNTLKQSLNSLSQETLSAKNAADTLTRTQRAYQSGNASKTELENAEYQSKTTELSKQSAQYQLAADYYSYLAGVEGLATADQS